MVRRSAAVTIGFTIGFAIVFTIVFAIVAPPRALADTRKLTIDEALAIARKNNRSLRAAEARLAQAQTGIAQAWVALLPVATAQGKFTHNYKDVTFDIGALYSPFLPFANQLSTSGDPNAAAAGRGLQSTVSGIISSDRVVLQRQEQLDGVLNVTVPVIVPFAYAGLSAARRSSEAAESNFDATMATVLLDVAQSFYAAAGTDELIRVRHHGIQVAQETRDNAQARLENGVVGPVEVTRAELAMVQAKQALVEALDTQSQAYRALAVLLDLHEPFSVEPPAAPPAPPRTDADLAEKALARRPEIAAIERTLEANRAQEVAAILRWTPSLSAFGNARAFNYAGFSGDKYSWAVGAQLDWTIFDGGAREVDRRLSAAQHLENEARLSELRDQISSEVANAARVVDTKRQAFEAARRSVGLSTETLDLVRAQHDAGTASQIDLLQAQDSLIAAEVALAQARFDLALAALSFERATGSLPAKQ